MPELSDAELAAVIAALKERLDRDRYPRAPRLEPFRSALAKLDPTSVRKPLTPRTPLPQAPTRAAAAQGGSQALRWRSNRFPVTSMKR